MKIGIATWHYSPNYGGLLQAYALQEIIKRLGYSPEFVNYRPDLNTSRKRFIRKLKDFYMMLFRPGIYSNRQLMYNFISENFSLGKLYYDYNDLCTEADKIYDVGICGSDQIWSNNTGSVNPFYYLDFLDESKRISYAPSIGYNKIPDNLVKDFKKYVNKIRFLSIREEKGAEIIKEITGRDAEVVLDPSLLLDNTEWLDEIKNKKPVSPNEDYILLYILGDNEEQVEYAKQFSRTTGLKLIAIETKYGKVKDLELISGDPFDFVELINNARYILTDSFHGLAFSINLEKQFVEFKRFRDDEEICQNSRIYNLLEKTNLEDRLISPNQSVSFLNDNRIDYNLVRPLLKEERKKSIEFLSSSIKAVIDN